MTGISAKKRAHIKQPTVHPIPNPNTAHWYNWVPILYPIQTKKNILLVQPSVHHIPNPDTVS